MATLSAGVADARGPVASAAEAQEALAAAQGVFTEQLAAGGSPTREATPALRDLAIALPALDRAGRRQARVLLSRPTDKGRGYFGKEAKGSPVCNSVFCVHWSEARTNAPDSPAFVDEVIASVGKSFLVENGILGWQPAKSDGARGGRGSAGREGQVDVYITNLGPKLYGYAAPDPGQKSSRRFAYLVLDNDYTGFPSSPLASLRVTIAHEYNHILQFNYDAFEDTWMLESTATWSEEQVYPEIDDYLNYVPVFARTADQPLTGEQFKIYSEAVWNHWLSARYGTGVIRDAWAASQAGVEPAHLATAAYTKAIGAYGGRSFSPEFATFAAATAEWRSSPAFPDARAYPDVRRESKIGRGVGEAGVLDNTSYILLNVKPASGAPLSLRVRAPRGVASAIALVGRDGPAEGGAVTTMLRQLTDGGRGKVTLEDPGHFERVTAVIVNSDGRVKRGREYRSDGSRYRYSIR